MASETAADATTFHGGRLIARRLKAHGVTRLFTLSGGHLFSIYDGCREEGIDLSTCATSRPPPSPQRGGRR